jgi:hypothetical protein
MRVTAPAFFRRQTLSGATFRRQTLSGATPARIPELEL